MPVKQTINHIPAITNAVDYSSVMQSLHKLRSEYTNKDEYVFGTIYFTFDTESVPNAKIIALQTELSAVIKNAVADIDELNENKQARINISNYLANMAGTVDANYNGCGFFFVLKTDSHSLKEQGMGQDNNAAIIYSKLVPLIHIPKNKTTIGRDFDLTGILHSSQTDKSVLVLQIYEDIMNAFVYKQLQLSEFSEVFNDYIKYTEAEPYNDERSPGMQGTHGNRTDRNYTEDFVSRFLKEDIQDFVQKISDKFDTVLLYYSEKFESSIQQKIADFEKTFDTVKVISRLPSDDSELLANVATDFNGIEVNSRLSAITKVLQQNPDSYSTTIEEIIDNLVLAKVDQLIVPVSVTIPGYISASGDPFVSKDSDSVINNPDSPLRKVDSILPALIDKAFQTGGKVLIVTDDEFEQALSSSGLKNSDTKALAQLRY